MEKRVRLTSPNKHTIGIDASRGFCSEPTGTERYATEVIRRLVRPDMCLYRLYVRGVPSATLPTPADVRSLRPPRLWTHVGLAIEVARETPDVLFVPAHVMPLACRPPAVVTVHDLGFLAYPESHPWARRTYLRWSTRRNARAATHLVADSAATRDDLVRRYGTDPDKITVAHLGVDASMRPAGGDAARAVMGRIGLDPDRPYLLHVGTLQPRKNLSRLVEALSVLVSTHRDLDLVLAGKPGWGDEDLGTVADRCGVADRVKLVGYVARGDLPALYSGAAAVVIPSLYEGFGLPALEAMACGAPVAVSNTSSLPEVVEGAGLVFDPLSAPAMAAAVDTILSNGALRTRLAEDARSRAARFTWDSCTDRIRAVLDRVAGPSRASTLEAVSDVRSRTGVRD